MIRRPLLALLAITAGVVLAAPAEAGQAQHFSGHRTFSIPLNVLTFHHRQNVRLGGQRIIPITPQFSSIRLGAPKHFAHGNFRPDRFGVRHFAAPVFESGNFSNSQIAIVVGAAAAGGSAPAEGPGRVILENGQCAPGEYCVLRLGYGSSAPKIITLNTGPSVVKYGAGRVN